MLMTHPFPESKWTKRSRVALPGAQASSLSLCWCLCSYLQYLQEQDQVIFRLNQEGDCPVRTATPLACCSHSLTPESRHAMVDF